MSDITVFDKILSGEIPSQKIYDDEYVYAFLDIEPQAPTHVIVIPKKKLQNLYEAENADPLDLGHFLMGISKTAKVLGLEKNGYRVVINNGKDGQQSVEYLHAHILGGRSLSWPPG